MYICMYLYAEKQQVKHFLFSTYISTFPMATITAVLYVDRIEFLYQKLQPGNRTKMKKLQNAKKLVVCSYR